MVFGGNNWATMEGGASKLTAGYTQDPQDTAPSQNDQSRERQRQLWQQFWRDFVDDTMFPTPMGAVYHLPDPFGNKVRQVVKPWQEWQVDKDAMAANNNALHQAFQRWLAMRGRP